MDNRPSEFNEIETKLRMTLDSLSNNEGIEVLDEWIETAVDDFRIALKKQFTPNTREFQLRASNIGRPLCQLQNENNHEPTSRRDYNHIIRMLIGDSVEAITRVIIKAAGLNITGSKNKVQLAVNDTIVPGEDDIEIEGAVWDIKSTAPWAFNNKWAFGWDGVYGHDEFGYVEQLYVYAKAQSKAMGGWIVVDKSSGEIKVVPATPTPDQIKQIEADISYKEQAITKAMPFRRGFEEEDETFYKKPTGNKVVPFICTWCDYIKKCWPNATLRPQALSQAKNKKSVWYTEYNNNGKELNNA